MISELCVELKKSGVRVSNVTFSGLFLVQPKSQPVNNQVKCLIRQRFQC